MESASEEEVGILLFFGLCGLPDSALPAPKSKPNPLACGAGDGSVPDDSTSLACAGIVIVKSDFSPPLVLGRFLKMLFLDINLEPGNLLVIADRAESAVGCSSLGRLDPVDACRCSLRLLCERAFRGSLALRLSERNRLGFLGSELSRSGEAVSRLFPAVIAGSREVAEPFPRTAPFVAVRSEGSKEVLRVCALKLAKGTGLLGSSKLFFVYASSEERRGAGVGIVAPDAKRC